MSTSTRTLTTTPAALAAVPMAATFSEWSTTIIVSGASATSFMSLAIEVGGTISVVINSPRMPAGHHLGLAQLGAGDTQRAGLDLALRDLRALVGLGVRADRFAGAAHVRRHPLEVALEAIEIEQQRGGWNLVSGHGGGHSSISTISPLASAARRPAARTAA